MVGPLVEGDRCVEILDGDSDVINCSKHLNENTRAPSAKQPARYSGVTAGCNANIASVDSLISSVH